ncbi:MAG: heme lyase CcmF/NrfE family subunit [marine benthic group bacterium]|jgi:cytochrome c-type biogenesis protein CcmF|nr:heme lyase CcmF/NrfE family subunit [Candidatus Benthicola marisminoris]
MLNLIGSVSIAAALLGALAATVTGIVGGYTRKPVLIRAARYSTYFVFFAMSAAFIAMEVALLTHDFSVKYVARVGSLETPTYYTAISLWSSLEGSILFWGWILAAYGALVAFVNRKSDSRLIPFAEGVMGFVGLFFYGLLAGPANPFGEVFPVPANGPGPNPLLQNHPLMGLHPPMLYLGYVGLTVPFAFAIGALLSGKLDEEWIRATRRWTVAAWAFLSVGIVGGAWWSYEVLGWGGYWAWDPVENASFLPWLTATAFLHSVMVQERRGMLKTWNLSLIIGTFLLVLFGTFLTRSGILDSVHAFTEGMIGPIFLAFIALIMVLSLVLIAWRSDRLHAPGSLDAVVSRESMFILNNLFFVAFTFTVLLGTTFPLIVEAVNGNRVSVGPPYFNMVSIPLGVLLLFLMGIGPALPWRRTSPEKLKRTFIVPSAVGLAAGLLGFALGTRSVWPLVTFTFAGFVSATIVEEFRKGVKARMRIANVSAPVALGQILTRNNRRYGGYIVHAGIVVIIVALALSGTYRFEREVTLRQGELMQLGDYGVMFDELWAEEQPQRFVVGGTFSIFHRGDPAGTMQPSMNYYPNSQQPIGTPAVRSTLKEDLYLTLMAFDEAQGSHATVRAIVNPAVPWLWIGGMIVALGAILAVMPQRGSGRPAVSATVIASEEESAELVEEPTAVPV